MVTFLAGLVFVLTGSRCFRRPTSDATFFRPTFAFRGMRR